MVSNQHGAGKYYNQEIAVEGVGTTTNRNSMYNGGGNDHAQIVELNSPAKVTIKGYAEMACTLSSSVSCVRIK